jgi:ketosteroid isomerase-like protein
MASARELLLRYLDAFCAGDVDAVASLLAEDAVFSGPFVPDASRERYVAALRADPPEAASYEMHQLIADETGAAAFFRYDKRGARVNMALFVVAGGGKLTRLRLLFDPRELAADDDTRTPPP